MSITLPLHDLRVIDLAQYVAGAYCTMLLGDLGGDVVKVELPGSGDPYRYQGPEFVAGESTLFLALNRSKRSAAIDWKEPEGRALLERLIERADVFVENARPGSLAKYGLDAATLLAKHPRLVYCSISGYGQTGPYAQRGGFDIILQGEGGLMAVTGEKAGPPVKVGAPVLDVGSAICAVVGILAALRRRDATGLGGHVEASLLDFSLATLATVAQAFFATGRDPERMGSASPSFAPYQAFAVADGHMTIGGSGSESLWQRFCEVIGRAELIQEERFLTNTDRVRNQDELVKIIEPVLKTRSRSAWLRDFEAAGVPAGPINKLSDLFSDEHVLARAGVISMPHPKDGDVPGINSPLRLDGEGIAVVRPAPLLGEHTSEVLASIGLDPGEVERLRQAGVVG